MTSYLFICKSAGALGLLLLGGCSLCRRGKEGGLRTVDGPAAPSWRSGSRRPRPGRVGLTSGRLSFRILKMMLDQ